MGSSRSHHPLRSSPAKECTYLTCYGGRFPDSRIILLANAFPAASPPVAYPVGVRPRSQWRVREGIAPSSRQLYLYSKNCTSVHRSTIIARKRQARFCLIAVRVAGAVPEEGGAWSALRELTASPPHAGLLAVMWVNTRHHSSGSLACAGIASSRVHELRSRGVLYFSRLGWVKVHSRSKGAHQSGTPVSWSMWRTKPALDGGSK